MLCVGESHVGNPVEYDSFYETVVKPSYAVAEVAVMETYFGPEQQHSEAFERGTPCFPDPESAIKHALGRGDMPISGREALLYFGESGYRFLAVEPEHAVTVEELPALHADPFDRILVAQALVEPMRLMTHDPQVARYSDTIIRI